MVSPRSDKRTESRNGSQYVLSFKTFGPDGLGLVPVPSVIESSVTRQYDLKLVGRIDSIRERFYAISVERKLRHPAVLWIAHAARSEFARKLK